MTIISSDAINLTSQSGESAAGTLLCWKCGASLTDITAEPRTSSTVRICPNCATPTQLHNGIWIAISPKRIDSFHKFITEYEFIRNAEGRGSSQPNYYLNLPYKDLSGRNESQWGIRARTFEVMERRIIKPLAQILKRPLRVLDLGAGNGWLSYRLAIHGHVPIAVDLLTNNHDGLGAAIHFGRAIDSLFPRVQAELDRLPFSTSTFDLAIFNASFHYSEDYESTFAEALRCIRPGGAIVIADTPWYAQEKSGEMMVIEKHQRFADTYGFRSDSIPSLEYLTPARLRALRDRFELKWETIRPFYGIRWSLRGIRAKLAGQRARSKFRIYVARVAP
jgi:SAM-dependent methyltransferase